MTQSFLRLLVASMACAYGALAETPPSVKWIFEAKSNLYAPPLVADMHTSPGLEVVISDAEARRVCCLDTNGKQLWEYVGGWKKRQTASCAFSAATRAAKGTLAVLGSDGLLCVFDAETATTIWTKQLPSGTTWGGVLWADLDGDDTDEAVMGTERDGVYAFFADGAERWHYMAQQAGAPLEITGCLAAVNVDEKAGCEIFACGKRGPFSLDGNGAVRWETITGDEFPGAPALKYGASAKRWFLTTLSHNADAAITFAADTGAVAWRAPLGGDPGVYAGASVAIGNLDASLYDDPTSSALDMRDEIVTGNDTGLLTVLQPHASTPVSWTFSTEKPTCITSTLGDIDGDGFIEILAASGDHSLYCLAHDGRLKWRYETGLRLTAPPTLADVENDGEIEILLCGGDRKVYCLSARGKTRTALLPWPSRRGGPAQQGVKIERMIPYIATQTAYTPAFNGGFETDRTLSGLARPPEKVLTALAALPLGWQPESAPLGPPATGAPSPNPKLAINANAPREGACVLAVTGPARVVSDRIPFDAPVRAINAEIWGRGAGISGATLRLVAPDGAVDEKKLARAETKNGWTAFRLSEQFAFGTACANIAAVQWALDCGPDESSWDSARIEAALLETPTIHVLVNQAGYDAGAPKPFLVQCNTNWQKTPDAPVCRYALLQENSIVREGELEAAGRVLGAHGSDWGFEYWRGNLDDFNLPGVYRLRVYFENATESCYGFEGVSQPFEIGPSLLFNKTAEPAYRYFHYQRCGMAIPGFHGACHLDDAVAPDGTQYECWGGWHDAGDYNTYHNAPYAMGLARAYGMQHAAFDTWDRDGNGRGDLFDEILWGGDHTRRMLAEDGSARGSISSGYGFWSAPELETDNLPGTGDERPMSAATGDDPSFHHAVLARIGLMLAGGETRVCMSGVEGPPVTAQEWLEAAARGLTWALEHGQRGPLQFSTAVDLFAATRKPEYRDLAAALLNELGLADLRNDGWHGASISYALVDAVERCDALTGEDHRAQLGAALTAKAETMLPLADNVFGVYTFGPADKPNFFGTPADGPNDGWRVGTSSRLLDAATIAALAFKYNPDPRFLRFAYDQINWTLGLNPYGVSLMEGCGSHFAPTYHHRYAFSGVPRGAVPGSVINGFTWRGAGDDRPYLDMTGVDIPKFQSNESWLPHNTHYLNAIAALSGTK